MLTYLILFYIDFICDILHLITTSDSKLKIFWGQLDLELISFITHSTTGSATHTVAETQV